MAADPTIPIPGRDSAPYWAALAQGRLEVQQCLDCEAWTWPPRPVCSGCHGENLAFRPVRGTGEVHSWVRPHRGFFPSLKPLVPFTIVLVRLDEQDDILIPGRLVSDVDVFQGMRVRAVPEARTEEVGEILWDVVDGQAEGRRTA
jgi:uncharacterized OB-fold protein